MPMLPIGLACGGCFSCGDCEIAADDCNRPNNVNPNTGAPFTWGGVTGDMILFTNEIVITSAAPEKLTCPTAHPDSTGSGVVSAKFKADDGDECEVWLNGTDDDNCTVARVTVGSSQTIEIITRSGGSDTVIESATCTTVAYDQFTLTLYYDASVGTAKAVCDGGDVCAVLLDEVGDLAGFAIGSNSGLVYVDDWLYQRLGDGENGCPELEGCGFDPCYHFPVSSSWEAVLTITGVADGSCNGCDTILNNSFVVPFFVSGSGSTKFELRYTETGLCSGDGYIEMWVHCWCFDGPPGLAPGIEVFIRAGLFFGDAPAQSSGSWKLSTPGNPDLFETYISSDFTLSGLAGTRCDFSGLTFTLTFNPP